MSRYEGVEDYNKDRCVRHFFAGCLLLLPREKEKPDTQATILVINESKLDNTINDHESLHTGFWNFSPVLRSHLNFKVCEELIIDTLECLIV